MWNRTFEASDVPNDQCFKRNRSEVKPCLGWQCKCRAISISNETINLTARKQYVATQGAASIITLKAAASESRSSVTVTANFKAWIKGSCHLLLITCYQDCVRSPCPSSESFPAFSWWCLFYYSVPVMSDWLFARNTCVHPAGISMTGPLHSQPLYAVKARIGCFEGR